MNRSNGGDSLYLYDDPSGDDDISSIPAIEFGFSIDDWYWFLSLKGEAANSKFMTQTFLVDGFEKPRAKFFVNGDCCANDFMCEFPVGH